MIEVKVNGKPTTLDSVRTIADLIHSKNLKPALVAVEQNGAIVPRGEFEQREIMDGDTLEIVHFVGGG